ncbi:unnamed protein product [Phaeothamnion confervicola]
MSQQSQIREDLRTLRVSMSLIKKEQREQELLENETQETLETMALQIEEMRRAFGVLSEVVVSELQRVGEDCQRRCEEVSATVAVAMDEVRTVRAAVGGLTNSEYGVLAEQLANATARLGRSAASSIPPASLGSISSHALRASALPSTTMAATCAASSSSLAAAATLSSSAAAAASTAVAAAHASVEERGFRWRVDDLAVASERHNAALGTLSRQRLEDLEATHGALVAATADVARGRARALREEQRAKLEMHDLRERMAAAESALAACEGQADAAARAVAAVEGRVNERLARLRIAVGRFGGDGGCTGVGGSGGAGAGGGERNSVGKSVCGHGGVDRGIGDETNGGRGDDMANPGGSDPEDAAREGGGFNRQRR